MAYEPRLIAPFDDSNLKKWYKPWIIGITAFPQISDAYARRGVVRKREGFRVLATFPLEGGLAPPVQGLKNWINPATLGNNLIGFSLTKSYLFADVTQTFSDITQYSTGASFSFGNGSNDYYWACNFAKSMWITDGLSFSSANKLTAAGGIFYLTANTTNSWNIHQPQVNGAPTYLNGCLIIMPYKGRLVTLNTLEGLSDGTSNSVFQSRARWSQLGTPYPSTGGGLATSPPSPFATDDNSWRDDIPGKGGFVDADTSERIVSAAIIKDTMIVAFQRSTWRLRYTGNEILPFIWERLNTQYGCESTYSVIEFDEAALFYSRYGWIAATTNDVGRIDLDIPDDSFSQEATNTTLAGLNKVQGVRDFYRNFAFWTYLTIGNNNANEIYGYNYIDQSWTIFNPSVGINTFGQYRNTVGDLTWSTYNAVDDIWTNFNTPDDIWSNFGSGQNIDFPYTLGGDLSGNVYLMFEFYQAPTTDNGTNFNFSVSTKRFNPYLEQGLKCRLGYVDLYCTAFPGGEITVYHYIDDQQTPIITKTVELFSRGVINITGISVGATTTITTGDDSGLSVGEFVTMSDIVGSVGEILNNGTFKVGTTPTSTTFTITDDDGNAINTTGYTYVQDGFVYNADLEISDSKYTRIYLGAIARMHQLQFTLTADQTADPVKGAAQFEMQGLVVWTKPCGRIRG